MDEQDVETGIDIGYPALEDGIDSAAHIASDLEEHGGDTGGGKQARGLTEYVWKCGAMGGVSHERGRRGHDHQRRHGHDH